jgi:hypothetical protein
MPLQDEEQNRYAVGIFKFSEIGGIDLSFFVN